MDFCKGDRVRLLGRPEWGPGKVLRNSNNGKVLVSFEYAGDKLLLLAHAKIFKVSAPVSPVRGDRTIPGTARAVALN